MESHTKQKLHGDRVKGISAFGQSDHFRKEQNFNTTDNLNENTITSTELNKEIIDDTKEGTVDSMRTSGEGNSLLNFYQNGYCFFYYYKIAIIWLTQILFLHY